jgi:hypothetical protein
MSVTFAWLASPQARRARGRAADRVNERKILGEQIVADDRAHLCAMAARQRARGVFELGRPHVVCRRVDEIARERNALHDPGEILAVDVAGQLELDVLLVLLAVAIEAVATEREGKRRKLRIVRGGGEAIGARR